MVCHHRASPADLAVPKAFNKARARAPDAGLLDLGTLPTVKHARPDEPAHWCLDKLYSRENYIRQTGQPLTLRESFALILSTGVRALEMTM
jgi:hypothetical protein